MVDVAWEAPVVIAVVMPSVVRVAIAEVTRSVARVAHVDLVAQAWLNAGQVDSAARDSTTVVSSIVTLPSVAQAHSVVPGSTTVVPASPASLALAHSGIVAGLAAFRVTAWDRVAPGLIPVGDNPSAEATLARRGVVHSDGVLKHVPAWNVIVNGDLKGNAVVARIGLAVIDPVVTGLLANAAPEIHDHQFK